MSSKKNNCDNVAINNNVAVAVADASEKLVGFSQVIVTKSKIFISAKLYEFIKNQPSSKFMADDMHLLVSTHGAYTFEYNGTSLYIPLSWSNQPIILEEIKTKRLKDRDALVKDFEKLKAALKSAADECRCDKEAVPRLEDLEGFELY